MKRNFCKIFISAIIAISVILSCAAYGYTVYAADIEIEYIAHAGGVSLGYLISNSMEALIDSAERGYKLIEVDIMITTDGRYILNHDWEYMGNRVVFAENSPVDYKTFSEYKIYNKFTTVSLEDLIEFLDKYKNVRIITDTKDNDYSVLYYISTSYKEYMNRFIPQVYAFEDYDAIKAIGYNDIIITLYKMPYNIKTDADKIYEQAKKLQPYAITVSDELLISKDYISKLHTSEIKYFVHTINDRSRAEELHSYGIRGVYTDNLLSIDYVEYYYANKVAEVNKIIAELSEEQLKLLGDSLIYKYGSEICIVDGKAELIYNHNSLISPFENSPTSSAFLPLERTVRYLGAMNYRYLFDTHSIAFEYGDMEYNVSTQGYYRQGRRLGFNENLVVFYNMFSAPNSFFTFVFKCNIIKKDGYIIISKYRKANNIDEIVEILRSALN